MKWSFLITLNVKNLIIINQKFLVKFMCYSYLIEIIIVDINKPVNLIFIYKILILMISFYLKSILVYLSNIKENVFHYNKYYQL